MIDIDALFYKVGQILKILTGMDYRSWSFQGQILSSWYPSLTSVANKSIMQPLVQKF